MSRQENNPLDLRAYHVPAGRDWRRGSSAYLAGGEERNEIPKSLWQAVAARVVVPTPVFLERLSDEGIEWVDPQKQRKAIPHMAIWGTYDGKQAEGQPGVWMLESKLPTVHDESAMRQFLDTTAGPWNDHIVGYGVFEEGMSNTQLVVRFPPNVNHLIAKANKVLRHPELEIPDHFSTGDLSVQIDLSAVSSVPLEQPLEHIELPFKAGESLTDHMIIFKLWAWKP